MNYAIWTIEIVGYFRMDGHDLIFGGRWELACLGLVRLYFGILDVSHLISSEVHVMQTFDIFVNVINTYFFHFFPQKILIFLVSLYGENEKVI